MTKLLSAFLATIFAATMFTSFSFAQSPDAIADACKGKKQGEEVVVDGKKVKCPAPAPK